MTMVTVGIISGGLQIVSGIFGASSAKSRQRAANTQRRQLNARLISLENSRQAIINPFSGTSDLSYLASDLSGEMSNPMANLGVATKAAEIQIEQSDMALANALDTLRSTGASAGGATALAQAALKSKKGVAASIEQQEAQNEKLKAQGEQQLQQMQLAEKQRMQGIALSEGQRMQGADAAGKQFMFQTREGRQLQQLDRVSAQLGGAQARENQAAADYSGAITGAIGGLSNMAGAYMMSGAGGTGTKPSPVSNFGAGKSNVNQGYKGEFSDFLDLFNTASTPTTSTQPTFTGGY